jgi:hypothetical protein
VAGREREPKACAIGLERSVSVASEYERDQRPVAECSETGVVDETRRDARGHGRCRLPSIPFIRRRLETVSSW